MQNLSTGGMTLPTYFLSAISMPYIVKKNISNANELLNFKRLWSTHRTK